MGKAKGIRVSELAKELGVKSKAILEKCAGEGLHDKVHAAASVVSFGLAETIRDWAKSGLIQKAEDSEASGGTKTATRKRKTTAKGRKQAGEDEESDDSDSSDLADATAVIIAEPGDTESESTDAPAVVAETESADFVNVSAPVTAPTTEPEFDPLATTTIEAPPAVEADRPAIAAEAVGMAPVVTPAISSTGEVRQPPPRPTVTLETVRAAEAARSQPERKPVIPAPKLAALRPAELQGPRVVRIEEPDKVNVRGPRPRPGEGPQGPAPGYTTARPTTGRGVKINEEDEEAKAKKAAGSNSLRRRGVDGRRGEAMEKLKEFTEADLIARRDALNAAAQTRANVAHHLKQTQNRGRHLQPASSRKSEAVLLEEPITVKSLSAAIGVKATELISRLMRQNVFATINQTLDREVAEALALDFNVEVEIAQQETLEQKLLLEFEQRISEPEALVRRPAVVTILGHVDHGKTSLLDKIRNANVAAGEAGGITQHTAAWMVTVGEGDARKQVTFIDTPGHQAFTAMRARGANMTDVVVLVVSAAEGIQPQTIESINHARAAEVPIVVALNKIDRDDANPDMVLGQLAGQGLNPVEWGGDTEVVRTSAITGQGIKELIETLDYQSELLDLKADPTAPARGTVIESRMEPGLGAAATVLVQNGTLSVGDVVLCGPGHGRIRNLMDDRGRSIKTASPSSPVIVSGLDALPGAGDRFYVVEDVDRARSIASERAILSRQNVLGQQNRVTADNLMEQIRAGDVQTIHLIIKGDTQGSVETLVATVGQQNTQEVQVKVIHSGVGAVNESDVELAMATRINPQSPASPRKVAIIGFHVVPDEAARAVAEQNHIDVKTYRVIYEIFDDLKKALSGMLTPEEREKHHGNIEIRQVFKVSRLGNIAGCMVTDGHVQRGSRIRLIRDGRVITEDLTMESLKRIKEDVREVRAGLECGIKLAGYDDIKVGDRLEAYVRETFQRTL